MDLDYLEDLSNKELRKVCVKHNLPNIPITDSSRKVMLRKLRACISGQPESSNKTKRRETVHNTNISNNKAATTAAAAVRTDGKSQSRVAVNTINKGRRTVANSSPSPSPVRSRISHTTTTLSSSDIGSQSEEDDSYNTYRTRREERPELRRSVSLTKSGVLTTSYTQETNPLEATYEEMDCFDADAEESHLTNSTFEQPHYKVFSSPQRPDPLILPSYETAFEHKIQKNLFSRPPPQLTQTQLRSNNYTGIAGSNTNINAAPINTYDGSRAPFNYEAATTKHTLNSVQSKNTFDGFKVPFNVPAANVNYSRNISNKRRTTTGIINTGGAGVATAGGPPSLYPKLNQFYEQRNTVNSIESSSSEDEYEEENIESEPYETPFLSKFTRTIETAKRNTLSGTKPQARRGILYQDDDDVKESFSQLLMALERKYHLKQALAILITVILAIFLYVMVW